MTVKAVVVIFYASIAIVSLYGLGLKFRPFYWGPPRLLPIFELFQGLVRAFYPKYSSRYLLDFIFASKSPFAKIALMVIRRSGAREGNETEQAAMVIWFYGVVCAVILGTLIFLSK